MCPAWRAQSPGASPDQYDLEDAIFLNLPLLSRPQPFPPLFSGWHFFPPVLSSFIKTLLPPAGIAAFLIYMQIKPWEQMLLSTFISLFH